MNRRRSCRGCVGFLGRRNRDGLAMVAIVVVVGLLGRCRRLNLAAMSGHEYRPMYDGELGSRQVGEPGHLGVGEAVVVLRQPGSGGSWVMMCRFLAGHLERQSSHNVVAVSKGEVAQTC